MHTAPKYHNTLFILHQYHHHHHQLSNITSANSIKYHNTLFILPVYHYHHQLSEALELGQQGQQSPPQYFKGTAIQSKRI